MNGRWEIVALYSKIDNINSIPALQHGVDQHGIINWFNTVMYWMPLLHDVVMKWKCFQHYCPLCGESTGHYRISLTMGQQCGKCWSWLLLLILTTCIIIFASVCVYLSLYVCGRCCKIHINVMWDLYWTFLNAMLYTTWCQKWSDLQSDLTI